jgi:hypothetical protein
MQESKGYYRALSWAGAGGAALACASLLTAGVVAVTSGGGRAAGQAAPTTITTLGKKAARPAVVHHRRATTTTLKKRKRKAAVHPAARPATAQSTAWVNPLPTAHLAAPIAAATSGNHGSELLMVGSDGGVFPVGEAGFYGSLSRSSLSAPVTAVAADPATGGYWMAGQDGGVFAFHSSYRGGLGKVHLQSPVVAMAATPDGNGYWLASADGGVFAFGDAPFLHGVSQVHLQSPVVAMAATPDGKGYWLASADGGVFAFGDAPFLHGVSQVHLQSPVVAMAATPDGKGYWLASADGGVFAFGDAPYVGNAVGHTGPTQIRALVPSVTGKGYWLVGTNGSVFAYGDAPRIGVAAAPIRQTVAASLPVARTNVHSNVTNYRSNSAGVDLSQYQCGDIPNGPTEIAVVQVTGGSIDSAPNSCYVQEANWAGKHMSAYIYMDGLPGLGDPSAMNGPKGACDPADPGCQSYNYGYNWARHWVQYSHSVGVYPRLWWLDVERYSGWNGADSNNLVILGALAGLHSMKVVPGIYSSPAQWQEITGGLDLHGMPIWVPGAGNASGPGYTAENYCRSSDYWFGGGRLMLVQYGYQGSFAGSYDGATNYDLDYSC